MSKKRVIFFKTLISEFSGFLWNLFRFFLYFFRFNSFKKRQKVVNYRVGPKELMWQGHSRPCKSMWTPVWRLHGAYMARGGLRAGSNGPTG